MFCLVCCSEVRSRPVRLAVPASVPVESGGDLNNEIVRIDVDG